MTSDLEKRMLRELEEKSKEIERLESQCKSKKNEFEETTRELNEKLNQTITENRTLKEEFQCYKDTVNSLHFRSEQLISLGNERMKADESNKDILRELTEKSEEIQQKNEMIQEIKAMYDSLKIYAIKFSEKTQELSENLKDATCEITALKEKQSFYLEKVYKLLLENKQLIALVNEEIEASNKGESNINKLREIAEEYKTTREICIANKMKAQELNEKLNQATKNSEGLKKELQYYKGKRRRNC